MDTSQDKMIFLADFHVKARTWTNNTQVRGDAYKLMQTIGDYAEVHNINTLLIGGDFFDSNRPTPDDLVQTVDFLTRFEHVWYIRGNHDSCDPSYLEAISRIMGTKQHIIQLLGHIVHLPNHVCLTGIPWMPNKEEYRKAVFDTIRYFNENYDKKYKLYLLLHTAFKEVLSFDGVYTFSTADFSDLCPNHNINLLVGDVHKRDTRLCGFFKQEESIGSLVFHSPGSVYPLQFNEANEFHGVTIVNTKETGVDQFRPLGIKVRDYVNYEYKDPAELSLFLDTVRDMPEYRGGSLPLYVRVVVPVGVDVPRIDMSQYPDMIVQIQLEMDVEEVDNKTASVQDGYTLEQAINDEFEDKDVAEIANTLISVPDPAEELRKYVDFWGVERSTI